MVVACFNKFVLKAFLMPGNIFLMLVGLFVGTFGVALTNLWSEVSDTGFWFTLQENFLNILMAFGSWTFLLSFYGCMVVGCDVKKGVFVYCCAMAVFLVVQIGIASSIGTNELSEQRVKDGLKELLKDFREGGRTPKSDFLDYIFRNLECCGVENLEKDFKDVDFKNVYVREKAEVSPLSVIPFTCCKDFDWQKHWVDISDLKPCMEHPTKDNAYTDGCYRVVLKTAKRSSSYAIVLISLISIFEMYILQNAWQSTAGVYTKLTPSMCLRTEKAYQDHTESQSLRNTN